MTDAPQTPDSMAKARTALAQACRAVDHALTWAPLTVTQRGLLTRAINAAELAARALEPAAAMRIPALQDTTEAGALAWFKALYAQGLSFHPDDPPDTVISSATRQPLFAPEECTQVNQILSTLFAAHGVRVYELCYPQSPADDAPPVWADGTPEHAATAPTLSSP